MVHKDLVKLSASLLIMILASCWESRKSPSEYRSEEHTSELQSHSDLVCRLLLEKKKPRKIPKWCHILDVGLAQTNILTSFSRPLTCTEFASPSRRACARTSDVVTDAVSATRPL